MKNLITLFLGLTLGLTINAQTVEEIIEKNIKARGGIEKIKTLESLIMKCTSSMRGMEIPMKFTIMHNIGFRMDMELMGMDNYMVSNKDGAYSYFPIRGQSEPEKVDGKRGNSMRARFDLHGEFVNSADKGYEISFKGKEEIDGKTYYVLISKKEESPEKLVYIDAKTNLIYREISKVVIEGEEKEFFAQYEDYKEIDGYILPMKTSSSKGGEVTVDKYLINQDIDQTIFEVKL